MNKQIIHDIQKHILKELIFKRSAKYSELKPKVIESNLFSYHLQTLVKEGYIEEEDGQYLLSAKGRQLADRISIETLGQRIQPKISTLIILKNSDKYLLYRKSKMPFINHIGFPHGKMHLEERIKESANRELLEKTGLVANLKHRGDVYIVTHDETELISHTLHHIFTGNNISGDSIESEKIGDSSEFGATCFWGKVEEVDRTMLMPGTPQFLKLIKDNPNEWFFAEYFLNGSEEI